MKWFYRCTPLFLIAALAAVAAVPAQDKGNAKAKGKPHPTGVVVPADIEERVATSWKRHGVRMATLPKVTAPSWDARALGWVGPVKDQMDCGDCHLFSALNCCESALFKAGGYGKTDGSFQLSPQYALDCIANGGCDGGWPETTIAQVKKDGCPTQKAYGPYTGRPGDCKYTSSMKLYPIADYGYVGSDSGVPSTQAIKNALVKFGPLSVAVAVDDAFQSYVRGVFKDTGYRTVNHAVVIVGWDDTQGTKGVWIVENQWSSQWGMDGYILMEYGANQIGYAAMWTTATPLPPIPTPVPPGPTPPVPPTPVPVPTRLFTLTFPHDVKLGQTIHSFKAPCDIPMGSYYVVPAPSKVAPPMPDAPAIAIPSK